MLPGLIQGFPKNFVKSQAEELIKLFNLDESILNKETRFLSGGEKERIAILRSLITNPKVILADEPTGALDKNNAIKTMEILKRASEKRLVVLVTHNKSLAKKYADRIITIANGRISSDIIINKTDQEIFYSSINKKKKNNWSSTIINHNFKKRIKRNLVSILGMTISLIFCYLLFGFSNNSSNAIEEISYKHFDYGTNTISKEYETESNSSIRLVRTVRPEEDDLDDIETKFPMFDICPNYDAIWNIGELYLGNEVCNDIHNSFVYDFSSNCYDDSLILSGGIPNTYSLNDVVINKKAQEIIKQKDIHFKVTYENKFESKDKRYIDYFEVEERINVIAVVDEFDFLSTPKIYFDYQKIDDFFSTKILENYSEYKEVETSWKEYIKESSVNDSISSYSLRCFLNDYNQKQKVEELSKYLTNEIKLTNDSLSIKEAISSLTTAATVGLDIFLVIALVGSILILGVFSYSAYNDDKKESSILTCLGAKDSDIVEIFTSESLIVVFFSFLLSTVIGYLLQTPINFLLTKVIDIPNFIKIPFKSFLGIRALLPLSILFISSFVAIIFSSIPILLNKKISIKKELADL